VAQKYMQIYDDSVLKLSIKQGEERDRFQSENIDINSTDYDVTSTLPGAFTMGELAFTRDTNRVFVGNFTDNEEFLYSNPNVDVKELKIQQTVGGTLVGNKYLGYIDSKPPYSIQGDDRHALSLSDDTVFDINGETVVEKALLKEGSAFRSYEFTDGQSTICKPTEDKKWCRQSYYNSTYDAYDGDYMYDIYRNALIIFDHNIKPGDFDKTSRRRSIIAPTETDKDKNAPQTVYNHTVDMYGDGYVCLYNVIPDGDTLTFIERTLNEETGEPDDKNYTQNIIKVQKVYAPAIWPALDNDAFTINTAGGNASQYIGLSSTQYFDEIKVPAASDSLILPNNLGLYENVKINVLPFDNKSIEDNFVLKFTKQNFKDNYTYLNAEFVRKEILPSYTITLGDGLSAGDGSNKIILDEINRNGKIVLDNANKINTSSSLSAEPFSLLATENEFRFTSNLTLGADGNIISENSYPDDYSETVKNITKQYDNENSRLNYLVESTPLVAVSTGTVNDLELKFKVNPVVYSAINPSTENSDIKAVGIFEDVVLTTPAFKYNNISVPSATQTMEVNSFKDIWLYSKNGETTAPVKYTKYEGDDKAYISHSLNKSYTKFSAAEGINFYRIENGAELTISHDGTSFIIEVINPAAAEEDKIVGRLDNITKLYDPLHSVYFNSISDLHYIINGVKNTAETYITFNTYNTTDLTFDEDYRLEIQTAAGDNYVICVPTHRYVAKIQRSAGADENSEIFYDSDNAVLNDIIKIEFHGKQIIENTGSSESVDYYKQYSGSELSNYISSMGGSLIIDSDIILPNSYKTRIYSMRITNSNGIIKEYDFIENRIELDSRAVQNHYSVSTVSEVLNHPLFGDENITYNLTEDSTYIDLEETDFYISNEFTIDKYFDAWALYYSSPEEEFCLGGQMDEEETIKWIEQRRIDALRQFPMIPSQATSVILECKTGTNSSLALVHTGNSKDKGYDVNSFNGNAPTITGLNLPTVISNKQWTKDKELLNLSANSIAYIEIPLSIDNGKKHFSFKISSDNETTISLAAYRA
jgi:hypothetical protein